MSAKENPRENPGKGSQPAGAEIEQGGLQHRVARGLTWTLAESWGAPLVGLAVFVVLARLLTEADFGVVALAAVFMFFVNTVVDQGMAEALIQRRDVTQRTVNTAFWVSVATGAMLAVGGVLLADPIAAILAEPDLAPILRALSATFLIAGFTSTPMALLRRQLAFRELALRRLVAVLAAGAIAVLVALAGYGAWALVAQHVANAVVSLLVLWAVSPWRPSLDVSLREFRELFGFGRKVLAGEVLHFLGRHVDNLLIGAFLGTVTLGLYSVAYKILDITQQLLITAVQKIAFPVFARLQHDRQRLARAYVRVTRSVSLVIVPGYIALALVSSEAIVFLFGERWAPSAAPAAVLFLIGPVLAAQVFSATLFNAVGHPEVTLRYRLVATLVNIAGFVIAVAVFRDITAVAAAFVVRGYLLLPLIFIWLRRYGAIPFSAHLAEMRTPIIATATMAAAVIGIKLLVAGSLGPGALLALEVLAGAAVYAAAVLVLDRPLVTELLRFLLQAVPGARRSGGALEFGTAAEGWTLDVPGDEKRAADV